MENHSQTPEINFVWNKVTPEQDHLRTLFVGLCVISLEWNCLHFCLSFFLSFLNYVFVRHLQPIGNPLFRHKILSSELRLSICPSLPGMVPVAWDFSCFSNEISPWDIILEKVSKNQVPNGIYPKNDVWRFQVHMVQIVDHSQTRCNAFDFAYSTMEKKKKKKQH